MSALTDHQFCFLLPGEPYLLNVTVDSLFIFPFLCFCFIYNKNFKWKKALEWVLGFCLWRRGGGGWVCSRGGKYLFNIYLFIYPPSVYLIFGNFVKYQVTSHQKEILNIKTLIHMQQHVTLDRYSIINNFVFKPILFICCSWVLFFLLFITVQYTFKTDHLPGDII